MVSGFGHFSPSLCCVFRNKPSLFNSLWFVFGYLSTFFCTASQKRSLITQNSNITLNDKLSISKHTIIASQGSTCQKYKAINLVVPVEAAVSSVRVNIIIGYKNISWMSRVDSPRSKNTWPVWESTRDDRSATYVSSHRVHMCVSAAQPTVPQSESQLSHWFTNVYMLLITRLDPKLRGTPFFPLLLHLLIHSFCPCSEMCKHTQAW